MLCCSTNALTANSHSVKITDAIKTGTETGLDISPQMSVDTATKKPLPPVVLQQELKMAGRPEDLRGQLGR